MSNVISKYRNGNYTVTLFEDGTKIRMNNLDNLTPSFPESIDISITTKCDGGCSFCYLNCGLEGKHADLNQKFFDTLPSGIELALNGNDLSHPELFSFLEKMKKKNIICNLTVNQKHFIKHFNTLRSLSDNKLIRGLGISLNDSSEKEFYSYLKYFPNAVIHTIDGLLTEKDLNNLSDKNIKLLILGFKQLGRGDMYYEKNKDSINSNISWLKDNLNFYRNKFSVISFDNLALEHLNVQSMIPKTEWEMNYMGDEGSYTMYVDAVNKRYAVSSLEKTQYELSDSIYEMFAHIRKETEKGKKP